MIDPLVGMCIWCWTVKTGLSARFRVFDRAVLGVKVVGLVSAWLWFRKVWWLALVLVVGMTVLLEVVIRRVRQQVPLRGLCGWCLVMTSELLL